MLEASRKSPVAKRRLTGEVWAEKGTAHLARRSTELSHDLGFRVRVVKVPNTLPI